MKNVVLVEIGGSHDECLLTQIIALKKSGHSVSVVCNQEIKDRNNHFSEYLDEFVGLQLTKSGVKNMRALWKIFRFIRKKKADVVVYNTAEGSLMRNGALLGLFSSAKFIGIIHSIKKVQGSFTQKVIHLKIKNYLILSEYLRDKIPPINGVNIDYFYPIHFYQQYNSIDQEPVRNGERLIGILGGIENKKRDLLGFIDMLKGFDDPTYKFVFLGKSNRETSDFIEFEKKIKEYGLEDRMILFDSFISTEVYHNYLSRVEAIVPLIHPDTESAKEYFQIRITGAINVAIGYKIPLLLHDMQRDVEELKNAAIYYSNDTLQSVLLSLPKRAEEVVSQMNNTERYQLDYQEKRYVNFLFDQ